MNAPKAAVDEERARALGAYFARTVGGLDTTDDDTRFRLRRARVGQRVVDLYDPADGRHVAELHEQEHGWAAHSVGVAGDAYTNRATFAAAVAFAEMAGAILAVPFPLPDAPATNE